MTDFDNFSANQIDRNIKGNSDLDFDRFDSFLSSKNINLFEFYNLLFQEFFKESYSFGFYYKSRSNVMRRETADTCLEIKTNIHTKYGFPTDDDRFIFYSLVSAMSDYSKGAAQKSFYKHFRFRLPLVKMREITRWLKRLSATAGEVEFSFVDDAFSQNLKLEDLRLIEKYSVSEIDCQNFFTVSIEFAEWLRRGFTSEMLDRGHFYLVSNVYDKFYRNVRQLR